MIILDDGPSGDKADSVITADASNRPLLPPPKLMQANRKQKLIHLLNFPVSVPLDIEQLRTILKRCHDTLRRTYRLNVMFPAIFRYTGNIDFTENVQVPTAGVSAEENAGNATADDVYKYGYGSNNSYLLRDGPGINFFR